MSNRPVLLDTNVASFLFGRKPEAALYEADLADRHGCLSFQTVAELRAGAAMRRWSTKRRTALEEFVAGYDVRYPDDGVVTAWAETRAETRRTGVAISVSDLWVAATALALDLTLVAHDAAYRRVPGLRLGCRAPG